MFEYCPNNCEHKSNRCWDYCKLEAECHCKTCTLLGHLWGDETGLLEREVVEILERKFN